MPLKVCKLMGIELRDVDVNEPAEAPESSPVETATVEEPVVETPKPAEEPAQESAVAPAPVQEETQAAVTPAPEQPRPSRAEERIRNLARENKELKERMERFSQQTAPELNGEEATYDDLNKVINERAFQAAELLIAGKQVETDYQAQVSNWATDFEKAKADNPQLDPKSPDYDPELDSTLARLLDDGTGTGTPRVDILVSDVLKTLRKRESATESRAREEGKTEANARLATQMAEGAITPSSKISSNSEEMSEDELAALRTSNPKEWLKRI